jgi:nitroreductase/dihydropteridine reductase
MDIIDSLKWRYATKKFDVTKKLKKNKIDILKKAFNLTATSFGLQTISMLILSDNDIRKSLVEHSYYQKQVLEASHLLVICIQNDISNSDIDNHFNNVKSIRSTPEDILSPYRAQLKATMQNMTKEERQQWSTNQTYIALGNLMTVCALEGIDSCPMEGFIAEKYDEILDLKTKNLNAVLLLPIGYRDESDTFASFKKVRKQVKDAVIEM